MHWFKQLESLTQIPGKNYEGYLWLSDKKTPGEITGVTNLTHYEQNKKPANPFIREAYLYDKNEKLSVSIKHVPGRYLINCFDLAKLSEDVKTKEKKFIAHKDLPGKLRFKEIWAAEKDENCENFDVLKKKATVFTGFAKEAEDDKSTL